VTIPEPAPAGVGRPEPVARSFGHGLRFDVNLSILFPDVPLLERPRAAAAAGFDAVEMWWPFATSAPAPREVDDLVEAFGAAGVGLVLLNLPTGDAAAGEHGLAALPGERARFRDGVDVAADVARRLGGSILNCHYGNPPAGLSRALLDATAVDNLAFAAERAASAGATLVLEPLNPVDFPRYGLNRVADAISLVVRAAGITEAPLRILFDVYHVERAEGRASERIAAAAPHIGHVQVADVPGRGRPGSGGLDIEGVLSRLAAAGYRGFVGLEYVPSRDPRDTFAWLPMAARRAPGPDGPSAPAR
jgi:hydroxypyruvate isomerase